MNPSSHSQRGFTLVEMMVSLSIGSVILTGVITTYIFGLKGFRGLSNYTEMHSDGRQATDWFARDARSGLSISSCTSSQVTLVVPTAVNSVGVVTSSNSITHSFAGSEWIRTDKGKGVSKPLAENVVSMSFSMYDKAGTITTNVASGVSVQIDALLRKQIVNKTQSEAFLSARLRMRNID